jgi:phosphoglycerate dehydrogenase-like enzyme
MNPIGALIIGRDSDVLADRLGPVFPTLSFASAKSATDAIAFGSESEILLIRTDEISPALIAAMPRLRLIQALTTGVDHIVALPNLPDYVCVAAARGFHGPQMSELAFLFMLAFARNFPAVLENQKQRRWDRRPQRLLAAKTAVLVGVGRIAEEMAKRCRAFDMKVVGVSGSRTHAAGFDAVYTRANLIHAAAQADFLIILLPYTSENHHLIGAAVIGAMKKSAVLINISRGGVVDESALQQALTDGHIAGAGLDVFQTEPLPTSNPWWNTPNVILTSHVGGMSDTYVDQVLPVLIDNLRAFMAGEPERMRYVVKR